MFEEAEVGAAVSQSEYNERAPALRRRLLEAQFELSQADFSVIVLFSGVDGAGKGETANLLNWWLDPRRIVTRAWGRPSDSEAERPEFWRFWRELPPKGQMGVFLRAWYSKPLLRHVHDATTAEEFDRRLDRIAAFERTLTDDGTLLLKFWMHLGKEAQLSRFRTLEADPGERWRVTPRDWAHWGMYDRFVDASTRLIQHTNRPKAEWTIVEGADHNHRSLVVGEKLLSALEGALEERPVTQVPVIVTPAVETESSDEPQRKGALASLDMTKRLDKPEYRKALSHWQGHIYHLARRATEEGLSTILVFEGWDAAGKGGAIRRLIGALDARWYQVIPIGAPTDEETAHHYLWRFWRHLSRAGRITIFDRSWYGRVLVERVEGFATKAEWSRAYEELTEFEGRLTDHGMVVLKFWMHITDEEQERRFEARAKSPLKRWKLTEEDWRNRGRRPQYEAAVEEMVQRTSVPTAPWILVEADQKEYARIRVLREVCNHLATALGVDPIEDA